MITSDTSSSPTNTTATAQNTVSTSIQSQPNEKQHMVAPHYQYQIIPKINIWQGLPTTPSPDCDANLQSILGRAPNLHFPYIKYQRCCEGTTAIFYPYSILMGGGGGSRGWQSITPLDQGGCVALYCRGEQDMTIIQVQTFMPPLTTIIKPLVRANIVTDSSNNIETATNPTTTIIDDLPTSRWLANISYLHINNKTIK